MDKPIVCFDFDQTLTREDVQEFALLLNYIVDVYILTYRFDVLHEHLWGKEPFNEDIFAVAEKIGIPKHRILFTNGVSKDKYLAETNVLWHLDDSDWELDNISGNPYVSTIGIDVKVDGWKNKCLNLINNFKELS